MAELQKPDVTLSTGSTFCASYLAAYSPAVGRSPPSMWSRLVLIQRQDNFRRTAAATGARRGEVGAGDGPVGNCWGPEWRTDNRHRAHGWHRAGGRGESATLERSNGP
jgi:hypothetical protein